LKMQAFGRADASPGGSNATLPILLCPQICVSARARHPMPRCGASLRHRRDV
jgi:hypothetical protein